MHTLVANIAGKVRTATLHGRDHLVAPMTLIVPGVLNGNNGPIFYPLEEVKASVDLWVGVPILVNHPASQGQSGKQASVISAQGIGTVLNATFSDGKLSAEGWFDVELTRRIERRIYDALLAGKPIELSTGLAMQRDESPGVHNATAYTHVGRNYQPDHLAVLPDQLGACSLRDGCGVLNHGTPKGERTMEPKAKKAAIDAIIANSCCWNEADRGTLEAMPDQALLNLQKDVEKAKAQEAVANAAKKGFTDPGGNAHTWNEKAGKWEMKAKEPEKPVEQATNAQPQAKAITEEDLPDSVRKRLAFADRLEKEQRSAATAAITANKANKLTQEQLNAMDLDTLNALAASIPQPKPQGQPNYSGAAGSSVQNTSKALKPMPLPIELAADLK